MSKRILLVEDAESTRCLLQEFLENQGHSVCSLSNGLTFFQTISDFQPELILLDLKLPEIDGYTLLQQLQQSPHHAIPVIVVSAYAFQKEKQRAFNLGARAYLTKPVALEEFVRLIDTEFSDLT